MGNLLQRFSNKHHMVGHNNTPIGVNLSPGEWNSQLQKPSSPAPTDEKRGFLEPAQGR
jgi:hypothetical protein